MKIAAFVGHSFHDDDKVVVGEILDCLNSIKDAIPDFTWDHAEKAETKDLREKVLSKISGKNLFIGICTLKEIAVSPKELKPAWWNKNILVVPKASIQSKASDWVIQEIGLAVGREMEIILLLEAGVRLPGALQGNIERIEFNRERPKEILVKLIQMVTSLIPKLKTAEATVESAKSETPTNDNPKKDESVIIEVKNDWSEEDYIDGMFHAVFLKNTSKQEEILKAFNNSKFAINDEKKAEFRAKQLHLISYVSETDTSGDLKVLSEKFPNTSEISWRLASVYEENGEHENVLRTIDMALRNENTQTQHMRLLNMHLDASIALGKIRLSDSELKKVNRSNLDSKGKIEFLRLLAKHSKESGAHLVYCALVEGILIAEPDDSSLRFELARKYTAIGQYSLSVKHYKIITHKKPSDACWNNLGVAYSNLNLNSLEIRAYSESEKMGGTLAVSNMANKLIASGFIELAKSMCDKVKTVESCHENVFKSIASITEKADSEANEEMEKIKKTVPLVDLLAQYSDRSLESDINNLDLHVFGKRVNYKLNISSGKISCEYEYIPDKNSMAGFLTGYLDDSELKAKVVKIEGHLSGRAGTYKITERKSDTKYTLLDPGKISEGLILINMQAKEIAFIDGKTFSINIEKFELESDKQKAIIN